MSTLLNEEVIQDCGCFKRIRRWYLGWIQFESRRGQTIKHIQGFRGKETEVTTDAVFPVRILEVKGDIQ